MLFGFPFEQTNATQNVTDITGDHITIHMVTHTHDDPGWLITIDQYYVQEVEWIFYTMIPILKNNPLRKFTYVEMAYMQRWWQEIGNNLKQDTISLVANGQLQMNLGGWCMNDEASPTVEAVIHQMTDGNQFILNNFGINGLPTVGWHVDPFGHSWVTAGLWAQAGFDAFALHRINYIDLQNRKNQKNLEFIWKGSNTLAQDAYIFCHILDSGYCSPNEIKFYDGSTYITTDPLLPSWSPNQIQIAETFISDVRERSTWYKHNQLLMPYGCDFAHQNAYQSMIQMDKLMNYINNNQTYNVTMIYSTLADYVHSVNNLNLTWDLEQPDFFPYVNNAHSWWTGYFTSRPLLKLYTRSRANELRVAEQLYFYSKQLKLNVDYSMGMFNITYLRDAFDVLQHHDAITGTERQAVADEYMNQLSNGTERVGHWDESVVGYFLRGPAPNYDIPTLQRGNDISQLTKNNVVVLVAYNSLPWIISEFLQIPSNRSDLAVYDSKNNLIKSQINPVCNQEQNSKYPATYNLFILAENMPPLSFETFFIKIDPSNAVVGKTYVPDPDNKETLKVGTGYYTLTIDENTNRLSTITNNGLGKTFNIENQWMQYVPSSNNGRTYDDGWSGSDPYVFRPATDNRLKLPRKNDNAGLYYSYAFRQPFKSSDPSPGFLVQPHSDEINAKLPYNNSYVATICNINLTNNSFDFQYFRGDDNKDYNEDPILDFWVFDSKESYGPDVQTASVKINAPASATYANHTIQFPNGTYDDLPIVLLSVRSTQCDGSHYAVTIKSINKHSVDVYIQRVDKDDEWTGPVYVDYMVYDPAHFSYSPVFIQGQVTVTIPVGTTTTQSYNISYAAYDSKFTDVYNDFIVNEPVILMGIRQVSPAINTPTDVNYYYSTTYQSNRTHFMLNLYPFIRSYNNIIELEISYIAIERITLDSVVSNNNQITNKIISGPLIDEIQETFRDGYTQTFRVFNDINNNDLKYIDNRIHIGPIDQSAELVTKYITEFNSNNIFYTNQAGLEYIRRDYLPNIDERIAGNFYPSSGATYMQDTSSGIRFSTIVNQGHGVGFGNNINVNGQYEIMLQRRLTAERIDEVLNTTSHTEPQIIIIVDNNENSANLNRRLYQIQQFQHSFFFGLTDSISSWISKYNTSWTAMKNGNPLPNQLFLQQLRYVYSGESINNGIVLQLQNMFEKNESKMSQNISIDLNNIFKSNILTIKNITEMNLFSTIPQSEMHRLSWNIKNEKGNIFTIRDIDSEEKRRKLQKEKDKNPVINMSPRDIKSFVINTNPI